MHGKKITRIIVICVALVMVLSCFGCTMVSVNEDRQKNQTVATANGTEITYGQFADQLERSLYNQYGYSYDQFLNLEEETRNGIQDSVLKALVDSELEYQDAIANGYELTDEQTEALKEKFNKEIDELGPNYRSVLEAAGTYTDEEMDKMVDEYVTMQLGEDFNWDTKFAEVCKSEVIGNYEADIKDKVSVTEDEIKDYYDLNVENQKNMLKKDSDAQASYGLLETFGNDIYVYPDDVRRVQHLLIGIDTETRNQILSYREAGETAKADEMRDEALAKIKDEAEEVYAKVTAEKDMTDEDFAKIMEEYGDDQSAVYGDYRLQGYLVHSYSSTSDYPQEMIDKALSMKEVGEISEMFTSDYGYEILRLVSFPEPVIPLEDMRDTIESTLLKQKQDTAIRDKQTELEEAADIQYFYDRVRV